jgi:hypothetical protein
MHKRIMLWSGCLAIALAGCASLSPPPPNSAATSASSAATSASPATAIAPAALLGIWTVDLRPTPAAAPYFQEFVVTAIDGKSFSGTFYGAPISQARINTDWGAVRFAFVTSDASGPYNHSGVLRDNRIEGLSNSTGRDFLSYWSAVKR